MAEPTSASDCVDNIIIGSGLAALATAKALQARGAAFEIIDVGHNLEPERAQVVEAFSQEPAKAWPTAERDWLFPPPAASRHGVSRRLAFGSDFPYAWPKAFEAKTEDCETEFSFALGGLANAWGGALLPYGQEALSKWPFGFDALEPSYRNVLDYVPMSSERDGLQSQFPLNTDVVRTLDRSGQSEKLLRYLETKTTANGRIAFGRARVAVDATTGATGCRACGRCLDGCVYSSLFSPRNIWPALQESGVPMHTGWLVRAIEEQDDGVKIVAQDADGAKREWRTRRLYVAAGQFGTTTLLARSLGLTETPIRILDSQYFHFPFFSFGSVREEIRFTLAELFLEILDPDISDEHVHVQVYGRNHIFDEAMGSMLPSPIPADPFLERLYLFQGYLSSSDSAHMELTVHRDASREEISLKGFENPRALSVAGKVKKRLGRHLRGFGFSLPGTLNLVEPGRSFHSGGSFPMGGTDPTFSSDLLGRPAGLSRVHIVDAANFPTIASSTIGYTIMANADRIARQSAELH